MVERSDFDTAMVFSDKHIELLAPGVTRSRLEPGGRFGPQGETRMSTPGGQGWNDIWLLGTEHDPFMTIIPDIRLPPNQLWPLHWHDCWIAVVIVEGLCLIGDWWMEPGDLLISAAQLEYGPVVAGPEGCQLFEVGAQAHLFAGGYAPEYADHVTLQGSGPFTFEPRSALNQRNEGRQVLPVDGVDGLAKGHLAQGHRWDLGDPTDPNRATMRCVAFAAGAEIPPHSYGDWHWALVTRGSARLGPHELTEDDVVVVEPGVQVPQVVAGREGIEWFEIARTPAGEHRN
jgi:quercetin dioxygenase-like cupin family protein